MHHSDNLGDHAADHQLEQRNTVARSGHKGATAVNMVTLATPVLALFLGDWLNGEQLTWRLLTSSGLIISGLAVYFLSWKLTGVSTVPSQ